MPPLSSCRHFELTQGITVSVLVHGADESRRAWMRFGTERRSR